jgi:hypothetical protein
MTLNAFSTKCYEADRALQINVSAAAFLSTSKQYRFSSAAIMSSIPTISPDGYINHGSFSNQNLQCWPGAAGT